MFIVGHPLRKPQTVSPEIQVAELAENLLAQDQDLVVQFQHIVQALGFDGAGNAVNSHPIILASIVRWKFKA